MSQTTDIGAPRLGRVNWVGLYTLSEREVLRFVVVWKQTLGGPLVTAALFLTVFALAIGPARGPVMGVPFVQFLAPGIMMMTVIQNAFANTSSSICGAKVQGNILDTLMPPLSPAELVAGYSAGAVGRGLAVAVAIWLMMVIFLGMGLAHPLTLLAFLTLGSVFMGALGMIAAIFASRFEQMAAITNFIITPLAFLSGTFYSIEVLPAPIEALSRLNPVFYLIDGVRYGVIGRSDHAPLPGFLICLVVTAALLVWVWHMFRIGYRLKS